VLDLQFPPIEHRRSPLFPFERNAARQARIRHPLRFAGIDRANEVGKLTVGAWRCSQRLELQLHLIKRLLTDEAQRRTAAARQHTRRPRRRPERDAQRARVGRVQFARAQQRGPHVPIADVARQK
jgi:hypothetical protein